MSTEKIAASFHNLPQYKLTRQYIIFILLAVFLGGLAGGAVVILNKPVYFSLALVGVIVFLLSLFSVDFGLIVLVFTVYTRMSDILIEYHGFISFAKPFLVVLMITILIRWGVFGERPKGWGRPAILFGLMSLTGLFSLFYSPVPNLVWVRWLDDIKDILIAVIVVILVQRGPTFRRVLWTLITVGFLLGTLSVYQYFTGTFDHSYGGFAVSQKHQIIGTIDDFRSTGPIGDPNFFAEIMVVLVPISLERFLHEKRLILRGIALWTFIVCVLTVIFTYSRGGFLAMVVGGIVFFVFYPPKRFQIPIIIFSTLVFASLLPPNYVNRLSALTELFKPRPSLRIDERSLQGRLSENLTALEMIKSHPLFGVGLSSYTHLFPEYSKKIGIALVATEREAHNLYLEVAAETGIIGFSVLILVLGVCLKTIIDARKKFHQEKMEDYAAMVTGFLAGWIAYLTAAMYIHNAFPRFFFLLMGIALSLRLVTKNTALPSPDLGGEE
jgi:putative inorganic carbon (hco3(-)) transporter